MSTARRCVWDRNLNSQVASNLVWRLEREISDMEIRGKDHGVAVKKGHEGGGEMVSPGRDFLVETQHLWCEGRKGKAHSERVGKEMTEQTRPEQTALSLSLSSHSSLFLSLFIRPFSTNKDSSSFNLLCNVVSQ